LIVLRCQLPRTLLVVVEIIFLISFILNDHIVQDYTRLYYKPKVLLAPPFGRTLHYSKVRLQNSKSSFHIFSYGFLCSCEVNFLIPLWTLESFNKCCLRRVYPICKIVPHTVSVAIHHVLNLWCPPKSQTLEKWRPIQDNGIIQRTRKSKEYMPNPQVL
jgi:hypothetical protein